MEANAMKVLPQILPEDLLQEVIRRGVRVMPPQNLFTKWSTCPHCGKKGQVAKTFGVRILGGTARPQSWCRDCRKNPDRKTASAKKDGAPTAKELEAMLRDSLLAMKKAKTKAQAQAALQKAMTAAKAARR